MKIIKCGEYKDFCDYIFNIENPNLPLKNSIVYCNGSSMLKLFSLIKNNSGYKYVIVHAEDDFSISNNHPKFLDMMIFNAFLIENQEIIIRDNFIPKIEGRVDLNNFVKNGVNPSKHFVIHTDQWIDGTFNEEDIPDNVLKIFTVHLNINHPKFCIIPYGVDGEELYKFTVSNSEPEKINKIYCKWSNNSAVRVALKAVVKNFNNENLVLDENRYQNVSELFNTMSKYRYCLCPFGNGFDNYRTIETLALGCIPIMQENVFAHKIKEVFGNIIIMKNILDFSQIDITENHNSNFDVNKLSTEYWKNTIKSSL